MNRRPKLSLVSNRELNKKQALDFEPAKESEKTLDSDFAAESAGRRPSQERFKPQRLVSEQEKRTRQKSSQWPDGKLILKGVIVVTAVALSLYLLKRRIL